MFNLFFIFLSMKRKPMSKTDFENLYKSTSIDLLAKHLKLSTGTIYKYIKNLNIEKKGHKNRKTKITFLD